MKIRNVAASFGLAAGIVCAPYAAIAQTKVACAGEQSTHSLHRTNDPEYPELMAKLLDKDFVAETSMAPHGGGFLEGGGTNFTIGNFGHPQGTVLNHDLEDPKTYLKSAEYTLLVAFKPKLIVLGPFGYHEPLTGAPISNFPKDMKALLDALIAIDSKPLVALATPLPESGVDKADSFDQVKTYTEAAAAEYKLPIIDLWSEFLGKKSLYVDDFHLTLEGRQHHAQFVADAVKKLDAGLKNPDPSSGGAGGSGGVANTGGAAGMAGTGGSSLGGAPGSAGTPPGGTNSGGDANEPTTTGGTPSAAGATLANAGTTASGAAPNANPASPAQDPSGCNYGPAPGDTSRALTALLLGLVFLRRRGGPSRRRAA